LHAEQAGALAVDVYGDGRVIEGLRDLDVAQVGDGFHLRDDAVGVFFAHGERGAADRDLDGRGGAEAHDARDDVLRFEGETQIGKLAREDGAEFFLEGFDAQAGAGLELHGEPTFLGAAVPEVDEVHGEAGVVHADHADGDLDFVGAAGFAADDLRALSWRAFGEVDARAAGGADAQGELAVVGLGEDFGAEAAADRPDEAAADGEVDEGERPAGGDEAAGDAGVGVLQFRPK
jgi:hypothetical protein